ncbi:hypothetical protein OG559_21850 [Micromonospora sp. NBC_01405]|uniref:hypothetical protein n=1 Tax=Micromonospora sp. NBC_01405 TaxID=2903589 RepID=UPI00324F1CDB
MLYINKVPIPDLSVEGAVAPHAQDIESAFTKFIESSGEALDNPTKQSVLEQLIRWSGPAGKEMFPSWLAAVRAANAKVKTGGLLGASRMEEAKAHNEEHFNMAMGSVNWANCGKTSDNILFELKKLHPELADGITNVERLTVPAGKGEAARQALSAVPQQGQILLLDCTFPLVHTFVLEVHSNGNRYLCQGYQGAYFTSWWTGKDDSGLNIGKEQDKDVTEADRIRLNGIRDGWGLGKTIPVDRFEAMVRTLAKALDIAGAQDIAEDHNDSDKVAELAERETAAWRAFANFWLDLPFFPVKREADSIGKRTTRPEIQITRIQLPDLTKGAGTSISVSVVPNSIKG